MSLPAWAPTIYPGMASMPLVCPPSLCLWPEKSPRCICVLFYRRICQCRLFFAASFCQSPASCGLTLSFIICLLLCRKWLFMAGLGMKPFPYLVVIGIMWSMSLRCSFFEKPFCAWNRIGHHSCLSLTLSALLELLVSTS